MRRFVAAILLVAVLVLGAGWIASGAYQAGLAAGSAGVAAGSGTVVLPAYGPGWWGPVGLGWSGFGLGFGFFGLIGAVLFFFLVAGLFRAVVFGRGHRHGFGPPGRGFSGGRGYDWFEEWHRQSHAAAPRSGEPARGASSPGGPRTGHEAS
jgi:hypothetical protein